jgi:hypothetical protein
MGVHTEGGNASGMSQDALGALEITGRPQGSCQELRRPPEAVRRVDLRGYRTC